MKNLYMNNLCSDIRQANGLSQTEFAEILGVSRSTVANAENSGNLSARLKTAILNTFGIDDDYWRFMEQKKKLAALEAELVEAERIKAQEREAAALMRELAELESTDLAALTWQPKSHADDAENEVEREVTEWDALDAIESADSIAD